VRNAIHAFNKRGLGALEAGSSRPQRTHAVFDENSAESLREMLHRSPREFGYQTSLRTLEMAAEDAFEEGLHTGGSRGDHPGDPCAPFRSEMAQRKAVDHLPDPLYERKKGGAID